MINRVVSREMVKAREVVKATIVINRVVSREMVKAREVVKQ